MSTWAGLMPTNSQLYSMFASVVGAERQSVWTTSSFTLVRSVSVSLPCALFWPGLDLKLNGKLHFNILSKTKPYMLSCVSRIRDREMLMFILCMDTVVSKTNACSSDCVIYAVMCNRLNNVWLCILCILFLDGCLL